MGRSLTKNKEQQVRIEHKMEPNIVQTLSSESFA